MRKKPGPKAPPAAQKKAVTLEEFRDQEQAILSEIVTFCNNLTLSLYADTTVVKTPEAVFRGQVLSRNRWVSEEYLLNYRRSHSDMGALIGVNNYRLPMAVAALMHRDREEDDSQLIALPPYQNLREPLSGVVRSRRSVRQYSGRPLTLVQVSTLLFHAAGVTGRLEVDVPAGAEALLDDPHVELRATASGGGLYPVDLFLLATNVTGLASGAYRYLPRQHALVAATRPLLPVPPVGDLGQFGEMEAEKAGMLLGYVYSTSENQRKYGDTGLAFALMETGAIAAHIHLACTALGLGSCDVGSFVKERLERLFDADGMSRHLLHLTVIGNR